MFSFVKATMARNVDLYLMWLNGQGSRKTKMENIAKTSIEKTNMKDIPVAYKGSSERY